MCKTSDKVMIKNILFDMGGIIMYQNTPGAIKRFAEAGLDTDKYMTAHQQIGFLAEFERGEIDSAGFCQRMAEACGRESISHEEAADCWRAFYGGTPEERLPMLDELRKHYHLGLLSNTNPLMMETTDSPGFTKEGRPISSYFDRMYLSYELKAYKPEAEIFLKVMEIGGMKPEETLFVDDAMKNIEAARSVGMHALYVPTNEDWRPALEEYLAEYGK